MKAELVILDLDGGEALRRCLASIERQTVQPSRVIIIDNGSSTLVSTRIGALGLPSLVIRSEENLGFTGGINLAMREVAAEAVGWVNNDVELHPRWLEELTAVLEGDPGIAGVQPLILDPAGRVDGAGIEIRTGRFLQLGHGQREVAGSPWGISATASLYRTAALREVALAGGILPPSFFAYYEDVELSARLLAAGWSLRLLDRPLAVHAGSASAAALGRRQILLKTRNRYWVRRIHRKVGSLRALLHEDLRLIGRDLLEWRLRDAAFRLRGLGWGLSARRSKLM